MVDADSYLPPPLLILRQQPRSSLNEVGDRDSSWPLYAMYSKIAEEEDNNDAERRQKDADGILVFVSPHVTSPLL